MKQFFLTTILTLFTTYNKNDNGNTMPPTITVPNNKNNMITLNNVNITKNALYNDITINSHTIYNYTNWINLQIININNNYSLNTTIKSTPVPKNKNCQTITTTPNKTMYITNQVTNNKS